VPETLTTPTGPPAATEPRPVAAGVVGLGTALPSRVVSNAEVAARIGVDDDWIERRTGIRERRRVGDGETLAGLATDAARAALDDAGISAADLDAILVATFTADDCTPGAAPLVAAGLGCTAAALDVNGACVGFLHALDLAAAMIGSDRARRVLVVGAEAFSRLVECDDRRTAGLFGDGAGAVVVGAGAGTIAPIVLRSAGEHADLIRATREEALIRMEGHETFLLATASLCEATLDAVAAAGIALDDVDRFVFHQANRRILGAVTERLALDPARVVDAISAVGNTSAASIPLALADSRPASGERVLLGAMGAGFVYGAGVLTWA
jgi:3-oxoacyl-[acyl-carrier-protein] synthase III